MISEISQSNFDKEVLKRTGFSIIDFWAPWCEACNTYEPAFKDISEKFKAKAFFGKVNIDKNKDLAKEYKVNLLPTTLIFYNGKRITGFQGIKDTEDLMDYLGKALSREE